METLKRWKDLGKRNRDATVAIAVVVGLVVCVEAKHGMEAFVPRIDDSRYLVARRALDAGQSIHFLDFSATNTIPKEKIPLASLTDQDLPMLKGAVLTKSLAPGEVLVLGDLKLPRSQIPLGPSIPRGLRAYPVVAANVMDVQPGDRIDVVLRAGGEIAQPFTLLEGILVLQAGHSSSGMELVLALNLEDIQTVEKAVQRGTLTVALRNPRDESLLTRHPRRRARKHSRSKPVIEIVSEEE